MVELTTEREYRSLLGELQAAGLPISVSSLALEQFHTIKSGAGTLYGFTAYSNKGSGQFIQLFDQEGGSPASGAVPVAVFAVNATTHIGIDYGVVGRFFSQGIVIANSSTVATQTAGSADCYFDVQYV